jgi:hypothetical protein
VSSQEIFLIDRVARDCVESDGEVYRVGWDSRELRASLLEESSYSIQPWGRLLAQNRPGGARAGAPVYVAQGTADTIVRPSVTSDFVRGLCGRGEIVQFDELPGVSHVRAGRASATAAIRWMRDRFEGDSAPSTCSKH